MLLLLKWEFMKTSHKKKHVTLFWVFAQGPDLVRISIRNLRDSTIYKCSLNKNWWFENDKHGYIYHHQLKYKNILAWLNAFFDYCYTIDMKKRPWFGLIFQRREQGFQIWISSYGRKKCEIANFYLSLSIWHWIVSQVYVVRCAISYHLYNLKNVKNTHGVLLLVK